MDASEMAKYEAMRKQMEAETAAMMKNMGLDPNEFKGGYDDPELAALDAELHKQGKCSLTDLRKIRGRNRRS